VTRFNNGGGDWQGEGIGGRMPFYLYLGKDMEYLLEFIES
jgi:hypothetical protein